MSLSSIMFLYLVCNYFSCNYNFITCLQTLQKIYCEHNDYVSFYGLHCFAKSSNNFILVKFLICPTKILKWLSSALPLLIQFSL